jgi:hypothetical protein
MIGQVLNTTLNGRTLPFTNTATIGHILEILLKKTKERKGCRRKGTRNEDTKKNYN